MKRIILPIDFTEISKTGVEHALEVELKNESSFILVHILSSLTEKNARYNFEAYVSKNPLLKKIPHSFIIEKGERIQML